MAAAQNTYISIDKIAELKGLKSNRTLRIAINNEKYKARKVPVKGGYTYEILFSSLEPEIQEKLIDEEIKSYSLVPIDNNKSEFKTEKLKLEALAKVDIINAVRELRAKCRTQKEADFTFLELYNSGEYLKDVYKIIGKVSARSTLLRWIKTYEENGEKWESLIPKYKCTSALEVNTELSKEEIEQFEKFLFHPNKFKISKAIALSKFCLHKKGFETLHSDMTYRRYVLLLLAKEIGVSKLNPSDVQHNFVNMCIKQNIPLTYIQKSLGYYGITNFVKVYRNLIEQQEDDYYNPLDKILKK